MVKFTFAYCVLLVFPFRATAQTEFVNDVKTESSVTYQLDHPLHEIEATSNDVSIRLEVDPGRKVIRSVFSDIDVTTFDSGNSNRDSHAMEVVDAIDYPDVTFSSTSIAEAHDGFAVAGKLTFHGITNDLTAAVVPTWRVDTLEVRGDFAISLTAYHVDRPSLLMIPVSDTLHFLLKAVFSLK